MATLSTTADKRTSVGRRRAETDSAAAVAEETATAAAALLPAIRDRIRSGAYPEGAWLPPERDLSEEFGVTRRAVRNAIARLAEEGLVLCRPRFRPIVRAAAAAAAAQRLITSAGVTDKSESRAGARLVALVMWHGAPEEQGVTAQQRIFWGLNERLARDGYHGIFLDLGGIGSEQENADHEAALLRYALDQGFAGVIFYAYAYRRNRELIQETARRIPLVLIDRMIPGIQADFVGLDNHGAMYAAARHLIGLGHRRILYITNAEPINTVQDRLDGYRDAIAEGASGGRHIPENVLTSLTDWEAPSWPVFESLFRLPADERPTAVLCVNDYVALNVHQRLGAALGLNVPGDVALAGFDGIFPSLPGGLGLTTVTQPFEEIGRAAGEAFLARRRAPDAAVIPDLCHVELPASLVVRESTDPSVTGRITPPDAFPLLSLPPTAKKDLGLVSQTS